jgi:CheY-like chemotaxis protein
VQNPTYRNPANRRGATPAAPERTTKMDPLNFHPCFATADSEEFGSAGRAGARRGRVLVVDDDLQVCRLIARLLEPEHEVVTVVSAAQALDLIRGGERFDIVLCDLVMPQMTGMDLHAELTRAVPGMAEKMVFMTGGAFDDKASDFLDSVPNAQVLKPFCRTTLRQLVQDRIR